MNFPGFTVPDGAYLPPELIYLLPNMSLAKLKVMIVVLHNYLQIGSGEPTSLTDIERMTGLSRPSVISSLQELLGEGMIGRLPGWSGGWTEGRDMPAPQGSTFRALYARKARK